MPPTRVAIVTCAALPEPDPDEALLLAALDGAGLRAELLAWDARPAPELSGFDLCVLRSTWNYYKHLDAFLAWVDRCARATRLLNPAPVVRWNIHKHYLRDLDLAGLPIVPTEFIDRGSPASFAEIMRARGWTDAVIKPCVSAASFMTRRFSLADTGDAQRFLDEVSSARDTMIQPYLQSVDASGERSIMRIGSEITHAIRKSPRFAGQEESVSGSLPVESRERDLFVRTLEATPFEASDLLYARLDLMPDAHCGPLISELELIEPSLFLIQEPRAMRSLVDAIASRT